MVANLTGYSAISLLFVLSGCGSCYGRPANVPGSVSRTRVTDFRFFARIANPCEIGPAPSNLNAPNQQTVGGLISYAEPGNVIEESNENSSTISVQYFQLVVIGLELVRKKLTNLEEGADLDLPECDGLYLNSLPPIGPLDNLNLADTLKQSYKTMSFLATHFNLMFYDRELAENGADDQPASQLELEDEESLPSWRFRLCGNESSTLKTTLEDVTNQMESVICTIQTGATEEQRASFRKPLNQLQKTLFYRYHSFCSTLRTRDCLVMREAKQAVGFLLRKFMALIDNSAEENHENDNLIENNL